MNPLLKNAMIGALEVAYHHTYKSKQIDTIFDEYPATAERLTFYDFFNDMQDDGFEEFFIKIFGG